VRIEGDGASASLIARMEGTRYEYSYSLNQIKGVSHAGRAEQIVNPQNPIIVQSDGSVLLEVENPLYDAARDGLAQFAELVKSPEHIHTYRITPLSLWNAAAAGVTPESMLETLRCYGKYDMPDKRSRRDPGPGQPVRARQAGEAGG